MPYKQNKYNKTSLRVNQAYLGETIEQKIDRILNNKEPIKDGAPIIYTERKEGVKPEHDIRTDRFDLAIEAMDKVNKSKLAKREERLNNEKEAGKVVKLGDKSKKEDGGPESVQATE